MTEQDPEFPPFPPDVEAAFREAQRATCIGAGALIVGLAHWIGYSPWPTVGALCVLAVCFWVRVRIVAERHANGGQ